jgi:Uma2 family endonuclease
MLYIPQQARRPRLVYEVPAVREDWDLGEEKVPESTPHDRNAETVRRMLDAWVERTGRSAVVCRNLAVRWDEDRPSIGVDPDVCVLSPPPPDADDLLSLRCWETGHFPPILAVEIVSTSRPDKDYGQSPAKYASNGTRELWVFDPKMAGPKAHGGPHRLQVWRRDERGDFVRVYAGEGPTWSEAVGAWIFAVNEGRSLRIADDEAGTSWWMTGEEAERAAKEAERAAKEAERAAKEEALLKAERLAQKLRELGIDPDALDAG